VVSGAVCLWHFGVKGKRLYLVAASGLVVLLLLAFAGGTMKDRFTSMWEDTPTTREQRTAQGSVEQRQYLITRAIEGIAHYPILGVGAENFTTYSGAWREVHMTFLQIAVEGGIPSLILYIMFFSRGFRNLRLLRKRKNLDPNTMLFTGALHSSLVGFVVGASFAPEAYAFFPFFTVAYTSALLATVREQGAAQLVEHSAVIA
jgi:O-antigen ligase